MAITAQNVTWYGPALAQGQLQSQGGLSGSQTRQLVGLATFTGDGATTTATLNWIDGVQKPFQTVQLLPVLSVTAPATIGGVANQAVYSGVGAYGQLAKGQSITFAGFSNAGNNGTFTINALTTSTIQVTNSGSVVETNPAATVAFNIVTGALVAGPYVTRAVVGATGATDTAAATLIVIANTITQTGCLITFQLPNGTATAPANGATISLLVMLYPNQ